MNPERRGEQAGGTLSVFGTGSQIPTLRRGHPGAFLQWHGLGLLIDPGETTQMRFARSEIPPSRTDVVFISHLHGDHCLGLPGVLQTLTWHERIEPLPIFCPPGGAEYLERLMAGIIWHPGYEYSIHEVESGPFYEAGPLTLCAAPLDHDVPCIGLQVIERDRWQLDPQSIDELDLKDNPLLSRLVAGESVTHRGQLIEPEQVGSLRRGPRFAYVADTRACDPALELAADADLLLIESTYLDEHETQAADHGHLTARQAALIARDAGVTRAVLAHFSNRYPDAPVRAQAQGREVFAHVIAARDGDVFRF